MPLPLNSSRGCWPWSDGHWGWPVTAGMPGNYYLLEAGRCCACDVLRTGRGTGTLSRSVHSTDSAHNRVASAWHPRPGSSEWFSLETNRQTCCCDWPAAFCFDWGLWSFHGGVASENASGGMSRSEIWTRPVKLAVPRSLIGAQRFVLDRGAFGRMCVPLVPVQPWTAPCRLRRTNRPSPNKGLVDCVMFGVLDRDDTPSGGRLVQTQPPGSLGAWGLAHLMVALFHDLSAPWRPSGEVVRGQFPVVYIWAAVHRLGWGSPLVHRSSSKSFVRSPTASISRSQAQSSWTPTIYSRDLLMPSSSTSRTKSGGNISSPSSLSCTWANTGPMGSR